VTDFDVTTARVLYGVCPLCSKGGQLHWHKPSACPERQKPKPIFKVRGGA
jgi:hypothetical protein